MTESANKEDRSPLYNRPKATMRMTESHHAAIKNKLRDGPHRAALFTFYFSLFVPDRGKLFTLHYSLVTSAGLTFHFHKRELPYITPIQCSTYGARMAVKMPLRVRPSEA